MAPTPYTPSGQLDIIIPVPGISPHRVQLPVDIALTGGSYQIIHQASGATYIDGQDAAETFWALVKVFYHTTVTGISWELQQRDENIFIPVESGAVAVAGTNAAAPGLGWQGTLTFKDDEQHLQRIQFAEMSISDALHLQYSGLGSDYQDFIDSVLSTSSTFTKIGDFLVTRADKSPTRFLWFTSTTNRKIRRARGLA